MKPIRLLNVGGVGLIRGKIRRSLASLGEAADQVEILLDDDVFVDKHFKAIAVIIFYGEKTRPLPKFKKIGQGFLDVEIELEMKKLQAFAKEGKLTDVFIWALLETLNSISQKYDLPIKGLESELAKYEKVKKEFCSESF